MSARTMFLFALAACGPGLSIASTNGACPSSESVAIAIGAVVWRLDAGIQTPVHFSLISNHIALPA